MPREYYKRNFRVTSEFGMRDVKEHRGADFGRGRSGDPILSLEPGVVITSGYSKTAGNWMQVQQDDDTIATYMHMQDTPRFKVGETVRRGDDIGKIGNTGRSRGPHLHLEVEYQGKHIDPLKYMQFGLEPFKEKEEGRTTNLEKYPDRQDAAIKYFIDKGYTQQAAIGIVGNLSAESSLKYTATKDDSTEKSYGLAQWNAKHSPDRVQKFKEVTGKDLRESGFYDQLDFIDWEIRNNHTISKKNFFERINDPNNTTFDTAKMFTVEYERPAKKHREDSAIQRKVDSGDKSFAEFQKREQIRTENPIAATTEPPKTYEPSGWIYDRKDVPEEIDYVTRENGENQFEDGYNYFTKEELLGQEKLTSLENPEESGMFAYIEYQKSRDEKEDKEKAEIEENQRKQSEATAAENHLRNETKKRKFLIELAINSLDYQAPTYNRVGKQPYTSNEQQS